MTAMETPTQQPHPIPQAAADIAAAAAAFGIVIPQACMAGVTANLALLDSHARRLCEDSAPPCA
ncbi:MAG: hypothetical protein PSY12_08575 [bacterium]|nr:hypothetical protein [bacterium]